MFMFDSWHWSFNPMSFQRKAWKSVQRMRLVVVGGQDQRESRPGEGSMEGSRNSKVSKGYLQFFCFFFFCNSV